MSTASDASAFETFLRDAETPFAGWDFTHITESGRMQTAPLTWSYASLVLPLARSSGSMLDMGTGGGEFLASLQPLPPRTFATEGYAPNIPIARERLEPLGVTVLEICDDDQILPEDDTLDLIINRHESYDPAEVRRVLIPGGTFITQQVGGEDDLDLNRLLGASDVHPYAHWTAKYAARQLDECGLEIVDELEDFTFTRYFDVGAIIYYLKAVPWQIPGFGVEAYRDRLWSLHQRIQRDGFVEVRNHRFLLVARKPVGE